MSARSFICTLNNPTEFGQEYLEKMFAELKAVYICGQLEKGKEGTLHLQFFIHLKEKKRPTFMHKYDKRVHIEVVKVNNGADEYCLKEDTRVDGPWEFGVRPVKRNSKADWDRVFELAKQGRLDDIPADIKVKHYANLQKIKKDHIQPVDKDHLRGVWIYGPAGIGKSRKARADYPNSYPKLCNKWWDGYQGQESVIMDDIGKEHHVLGQQLKIWSDRYGCILETKGGAVVDNYQHFIVTS